MFQVRFVAFRGLLRGRMLVCSLIALLPAWPGAAQVVQGVPLQPATPATRVQEADEAPPESDAPAASAVPAGAVVPGAVVAGPQLSKDEVDALRAQFDALPKDRQEEMKAYYKDLGVDLDVVLGLAGAVAQRAARAMETLNMLRGMDFTRTPQNVLGARAKIGFGQVPHPNPETARGTDVARWIHLQVMAGEWQAFGEYLTTLPKEESEPAYAHVLQALNRGSSGLLPEEVLAFAEACPEEPKPWQMTAWSTMLRMAAEKNSPALMLARIRSGTRLFGTAEPVQRRRTVDLLSAGGLVAEAYEYLTPIDEARAAGDGDLILVHGLYKADLAQKAGDNPEADALRSDAWDLFCEATLAERTSTQGKRDALKQAVGLMSRMPRSRVTPWLERVFASDALGPAALETIALSAATIGNAQQDEEQRAQSILTLKEAVDVLLAREGLDQSALRVPMRMLTTALVAEMENAVAQSTAQRGRQQMVARQAQLLLRAVPSAAWLDALEPSLAARAAKACVTIAAVADETDMALSLLAEAVRRTPDQALPIADAFLKTWQTRLAPKSDFDDDMMIYYFWREYVAQAPLTRGRQRRNLERLGRLMETVRACGVDPRTLPSIPAAFKACHGITEVYDRSDIERVFGSLEQIPAATAAMLAQTMAASLNGDWRNRAVQAKQGVKRSDTEIAQLVDKGYGLAISLIDSALTHEPESWRLAVVKAGLSYDRMEFRRSQAKSADAAKDTEYRVAAFAAFEQAARRYAAAVAAGQEREDVGVFVRWFGAAMGTSQLNFLNADELPAEGTPQDDEVEKIRKAIAAMPADAAFRHISDFARALGAAVSRADPEVKPKLVKQALRIVGDHPAGASLRSLNELYRDLVKDEIKLRLAIDGDDRVGVNRQFGVLISLRFTNSVDRETGGFSKYLQTNAFVRVGRQYQEVNFREKLQKNIESSLAKGFVVESVGFFDPFMPPEGVVESGQDGWLEKPLAYVVVSRTDPTIDRLPQLTMDMQFEDSTGPVTLVLPSNTPPIAVGPSAETPAPRPCLGLQVTQVVDARDARDGEKDRTIKLEVIARGKGAIPTLDDLLTGIENAIDGYRIEEKGIEAKPAVVMQEGDASASRFYYYGPPKPPPGGYPEQDTTGIYRLDVERSWVITYTPASASLGGEFRVPKLKEGVHASLISRYFSDMDLENVVAGLVPVARRGWLGTVLAIAGALATLILAAVAYRRMRGRSVAQAGGIDLPQRITPLSTVMTLRRIARDYAGGLDATRRSELDREIASLERAYFGPEPAADTNGRLGEALARWSTVVRPLSADRG